MPPIINAQSISKAFGSKPLFQDVSFTISEGDRIGLIGPNGSGKSTLLRILAGMEEPDSGDLSIRKRVRNSYVEQDSRFKPGNTVRSVVESALQRSTTNGAQRSTHFETLGRAGFEDLEAEAAALSGGWQKRLAIVEALVQAPDILLLDEPTNHLDLAGIEWLEALLEEAAFACVVVSHDRYFLENVATDMAELSRVYPDGLLRVHGNYSAFLEKKEEFLHAQAKRQEALENLVHSEIEWLRRGAKARTRKSKARIDKAGELMSDLADLNARTRSATAQIDFSATDRKTKRLIEVQNVACEIGGDRRLFEGLNFVITAGMRVGLVGPNGSGKTSLLRLLLGEWTPAAGEIRRADRLRIVYFDQSRQLDMNTTLRRALAPEADSVVYQDRVIHVASWAAKFLFTSEQLDQPVARLSGGERARVLIAQLMLQPADVLLLDEPTNDLDIPTLEILEESLLEFRGSLLLVTHDRYMLDRVSTIVLGLDGQGSAESFADYSQWESWQAERKTTVKTRRSGQPAPGSGGGTSAESKKKLSYLEAREYAGIEQRIADAERVLQSKQAELEDPAIASDATRLLAVDAERAAAQAGLDALYERWAELEGKAGNSRSPVLDDFS